MTRFKSAFYKTYWVPPLLFMVHWLLEVNLGTPWNDSVAFLQSCIFAIIIYVPILIWSVLDASKWVELAFKRFETALFTTHRIFWLMLIISTGINLLVYGTISANILGSCVVFYLPFLIWRMIKPKVRKTENQTAAAD